MDKAPRPRIVGGINVKVVTGCGNMYVQMGWCNGKLFEVFATLGRAGGCATCFDESLTRAITTGLRCGVHAAEYVDQLSSVRCPNPVLFQHDSATSCPDAISKVLKEYGSLTTEGMIMLIQKLNEPNALLDLPSDKEEEEAAMKRIAELKAERDKQNPQ